jgi:acyl dehydratase
MSVSEFATAAGDNNPIHHDAAFAAATRFGRPTASGPHTTALLLALTASHFSKEVTPNQKLRGDIVELRGRIQGEDGKTSLGAKGRVLVTDRL